MAEFDTWYGVTGFSSSAGPNPSPEPIIFSATPGRARARRGWGNESSGPGTSASFESSPLRLTWFSSYQRALQTVAVVMGALGPLSVLLNLGALLVFITMRTWKSPGKVFYVSIELVSLGEAILLDLFKGSTNALHILSVFHYGPRDPRVLNMRLFDLNDVTCSTGHFLEATLETLYMLGPALFSLNRLLVVLAPFKARRFEKLFSWKVLLGVAVFIAIYWTPHLLLTRRSSSVKRCRSPLAERQNIVWSTYRTIGHSGLTYFVPLLIIIVSNVVICVRIVQSVRQRAAIASNQASDREAKATCVLVVMSVIYLLFIVPNASITFVLKLADLPYVPYVILTTYDMTCNLCTLTLLRCIQVVVYFIMIPEFRRQIGRLFRCAKPFSAKLVSDVLNIDPDSHYRRVNQNAFATEIHQPPPPQPHRLSHQLKVSLPLREIRKPRARSSDFASALM